MLRKHLTQLLALGDPMDHGAFKMDYILHFEYIKTVLVRWVGHLRLLSSAFGETQNTSIFSALIDQEVRKAMATSLKVDIDFLLHEAEALIELCDSNTMYLYRDDVRTKSYLLSFSLV